MRGQTTFIARAEVNSLVAARDFATHDESRVPSGRNFQMIFLLQLKTPPLSDFLGHFVFFDKLDRPRLLSSFVVVPNEP
jgi:hypothetical protein